jgi:hypothetical protein
VEGITGIATRRAGSVPARRVPPAGVARETRYRRPRLGLAVDLDLNAQAWTRAIAARFGFTENTPREPWHWKCTAS